MDDSDGDNCACKPGYQRASIADLCTECHDDCVTCSGPGPEDCLSCPENHILAGTAPAGCICNEGSYPDGDLCLPCTPPCVSCNSDRVDDCVSCIPNASLTENNECECDDGFYMADD